MTNLDIWDLCWLPNLSEAPPESLLKDVNRATIAETNELRYSTATVIFKMFGYKLESSHKDLHEREAGGQGQGNTEPDLRTTVRE